MKQQVETWYYKHDADITFGEVHVSKMPKIILAFTLIFLLVGTIFVLLFKNLIYDYFKNPQLQFDMDKVSMTEDGNYYIKYEVTNAGFIQDHLTDYIDGDLDSLEYEYEIVSNIDTNKTGLNEVIYKSHNSAFSEEKLLYVDLQDMTPPVISFILDENDPHHVDLDTTGSCQLVLIRGQQTDNFNPKDYIKSITDNYTKDDYFKGENAIKEGHVEYPKNINFSADTVDIIYSATDEAGNVGTISLKLIIKDDIDAQKEEDERRLKEAEEEYRRLLEQWEKEKQEKQTEYYVDPTTGEYIDPTTGEHIDPTTVDPTTVAIITPTNPPTQPPTTAPNTVEPTAPPTQPPATTVAPTQPPVKPTEPATAEPTQPSSNETAYISAKDVTCSITEGEEAILKKCVNAITYIGTNEYAMPSGMPGLDEWLDVGVYTVTWTTSSGLSCTQKVTITE